MSDSKAKEELLIALGRASLSAEFPIRLYKEFDRYPHLQGHDLDVFACGGSWRSLSGSLSGIAARQGWEVTVTVKRGHLMTCFLSLSAPALADEERFLQIDFHRSITARGIPIIDRAFLSNQVLDDERGRWLTPVCAAAVSFLEPFLVHRELEQVKPVYRAAWLGALKNAPAEAGAIAEAVAGREAGKGLLQNLETDLTAPSWREALYGALRYRPLELLAVAAAKLKDGAAGYIRPAGRCWAFCGPDGSGKSTVVSLLRNRVERRLLVSSKTFHTRPYLLPRLNRLLPVGAERRREMEGTRRYEERIGRAKSLFRLIYLLFDYQLGYWLKVRPLLARGEFVIFDRYYADYLVDPRIRGIDLPMRLMKTVGWLVPNPDRTVFLTANADVLVARKGELSAEEGRKQARMYASVAERTRGGLTIDCGSETAESVRDRLFETLYGDLRGAKETAPGNRA